jgi:hypothetical protein
MQETGAITENKNYLQNFWKPCEGDCIFYKNKEYTIREIIEDVQAICDNTLVWLQDAIWNPSLQDIDKVVSRYNATVLGDTIHVATPSRKVCYFKRPDNLEEYAQTLRDIRFYTKLHGQKESRC